jgi:tRNA (adenine57-N1/adenine58-N1)-methyltransferase
MNRIKEGDYIILSDSKRRKWLVRVEKNKRFHIHHGTIELEKILGLQYGDHIETNLGKELVILKPTLIDYISRAKRPTQIVYPKDIGYIIMKLGIRPGYNILEVGTGSGAITSTLTWILNGRGEIDTYEKREDIARIAQKNISRIDGKEVVKLHIMDILKADLPPEHYDAVIIDIDSPWKITEKIHKAVKPGAYIAIITPTYNQLDKLLEVLPTYFTDIEAIEIFKRKIQAKSGKIRPEFRMIGYTTILVTATKRSIDQ